MIPAATRNQMRSGAIVAWTAMLGLWSSCAADPVELKTFQAIPRPLPTATLQYGTTATQVIDIFLPKTEGSHPLVILIHGGCWSVTTAGREQLRHLGEELARKNMAVWSIGYRRANEPGGGYPGTFQDVAAAIDLAASEAARYKLDLTRTVSAGHSAGGHLALWAAGRHQLSPNSPLFTPHPFVPRSVISLGGVGDVEAFAPLIPIICGPGIVERLAPPPALAAAYAEKYRLRYCRQLREESL
jgi:acetyl esterase/lipase